MGTRTGDIPKGFMYRALHPPDVVVEASISGPIHHCSYQQRDLPDDVPTVVDVDIDSSKPQGPTEIIHGHSNNFKRRFLSELDSGYSWMLQHLCWVSRESLVATDAPIE